jgi:O-antigen/teichoic acid export membrane protein
MVSTLPADRDPPPADSSHEAPADILDTTAAGPAVIRGSVLRLAGYVVGALATVASSAVVIRHLGPTNTARFLTVTALVTIVSSVSDVGLSSIAVREYSTGARSEGQRFLRHLLGIRITVAGAGLLVAVIFSLLVYPAVMVVGTILAGAGVVVYVAQQGISIPLQVQLRFGWVSGIQLAYLVGVAIEAVLLSLAGAGLIFFFAMQIPMALAALGLTAVVGGHEARILPTVDTAQWRRMLGRILPYSGAVVLSVLYFQIAQIMVSLLSSTGQTASFGVSFRVLSAFTIVPGLVVSSALPVLARAARDDTERFGYSSRRLAETMVIAGSGVALAVFLGAGFALRVVGGPTYAHDVDVLQILAFALLGTFVISARGYALLSLDRLRAILASNAVALAIVLTLGVPLISVYGAKGAAIALVAAELTLAACYELSLSHGEPERRLAIGFFIRVAAIAVGAGAVAIALALTPVGSACVGLVIYALALLALGLIPAEIRHALFSRRHPAEH